MLYGVGLLRKIVFVMNLVRMVRLYVLYMGEINDVVV